MQRISAQIGHSESQLTYLNLHFQTGLRKIRKYAMQNMFKSARTGCAATSEPANRSSRVSLRQRSLRTRSGSSPLSGEHIVATRIRRRNSSREDHDRDRVYAVTCCRSKVTLPRLRCSLVPRQRRDMCPPTPKIIPPAICISRQIQAR